MELLINNALNASDNYYLDGVLAQLHPPAWAKMLTSGSGVDPDIAFVLDGILNCFNVVNQSDNIPSHKCHNYTSCFENDNLVQLRNLIEMELLAGKLSESNVTPTCIHSMGVSKKKESKKIRPITDCSRPKSLSVNQHMSQVYDRFKYISIDRIIAKIVEGNETSVFLSTIDLAIISDHNLIYLVYKKDQASRQSVSFKFRSNKKYNRAILLHKLENWDWTSFYETRNPETAWAILYNAYISVLNDIAPFQTKNNVPSHDEWVDKECII